MSNIIDSVRASLKAGFPIFPLQQGGKTPMYRGGCRDATRSRQRLLNHWRRYPDHNYGIATGAPSGIFILDIDGPDGEASLAALCAKYGSLPPTVTVGTAKGQHQYFATNGVLVGNSVGKLGPGIDVRGDGGYVVGAGSVHPTGHVYRYANGLDPGSMRVAAAPTWLLQLVRKPKAPKPASPTAAPNTPKSIRDSRYGQAALAGELRRLASAPLHQRNDTLNRCAFRIGQLIANGYLDEAEAARRLAQTANEIGLEPGEIPKTISSGIDAGKRFPRRKSPPSDKRVPKRADGSDGDPITAALSNLGCTDADNAERFVTRNGARFAFCPAFGWLHFDGKRWKPDIARKRYLAAMDAARRISDEASYLADKDDQRQRAAHAKHSLSKAALDRMLDLAAPMMMVAVEKLDADPWLLNVANGTLDLRTGHLRPHDPRDMITKLAAVKYDSKETLKNPAAGAGIG